MSTWDWVHAGLEVATFTAAQRAQNHLSAMKNSQERAAAHQELLAAMKTLIFDLSRGIQLAEGKLTEFPQQVYIVAQALLWRFDNIGFSTEAFPDFQDKEYVFKTQQKIIEVGSEARAKLSDEQLLSLQTSIQYVIEMPLLKRAVAAKAALEKLARTEEAWQKANGQHNSKPVLLFLGFFGLLLSSCCCFTSMSMSHGGGLQTDASNTFVLIAGLLVTGALVAGSLTLIIRNSKSSANYRSLKDSRTNWQKQLMDLRDWEEVVRIFGDLPSEQYQKICDERMALLNPILGGEGFTDYF
jgi:hypothetical protein